MTAAVAAPRPTNEARIKAALWFAEQGFGVFSCWSTWPDGRCRCPGGRDCTPGKHPMTQHGLDDATTDPKAIRAMLSAASDPNYGLLPPDGVFVWDVDGEGWEQRLAELESQHGPLPDTIRTATRNGQHIYLRWPDSHPRPLKAMFGWVTRWGTGASNRRGYVIGPRSVHASGFEYAPVGAFTLATLPDAWARAALEGETALGTIRIGGSADPSTVAIGGRHDWLRNRARFLAGVIRDPETLLTVMLAENDRLPSPKTRDDVARAIGDALVKFPADEVETTEDGAERRVSAATDDPGILPPPTSDAFPEPPDAIAFGGLVGECVRSLAAHTDASLAGLLASFLAVCGALVPSSAHARGEQTSSPFIALVGESGIGRKGTAMNRGLGAARLVWPTEEVEDILLDGLNSGEALVAALHDQAEANRRYRRGDGPVVGLVFEEEFVNMLSSRARDGSTLDGKLRVAFDGGSLSNRKANDSKVVRSGYVLPALAGITPLELRQRLEKDSAHTGAANRWLYVPVVKRDEIVPDEPPELPLELNVALKKARAESPRRLTVTPATARLVSEYAEHVTTTSAGVARDLVRRYGTIAVRLAMIHAAVERSPVVGAQHLERAVALTEYARRGIAWVFGQTIGSRDADLLLRHLRQSGPLRKNTITRHIIRDPQRQQDAIDELVRLGYAAVEITAPTTGGRLTQLRATGLGVAFVPFVQVFAESHGVNHVNLGRLDERPPIEHEMAGFGLDERWTNAGRTVDERGHTEPSEAVVDITTGEVEPRGSAEWAAPCRAYTEHRDHHRNTPAGWVCLACAPQEG
jgi:hypothetical protein